MIWGPSSLYAVTAASAVLNALTVLRLPLFAPDEPVRERPRIKVGRDFVTDKAAGEPRDGHVVTGPMEQPGDVDALASGLGVDLADPVRLPGGKVLADVGDVQGGVQHGAHDAPAARLGHWPVYMTERRGSRPVRVNAARQGGGDRDALRQRELGLRVDARDHDRRLVCA